MRVKVQSPQNRHAAALAQSAARGRELARLLDPETPVPGVTTGALRPEIAAIAVPATIGGRNMSGDDFELAAGWGHFGSGQAVMPGQGRIVQRPHTPAERQALSVAAPAGETGDGFPVSPGMTVEGPALGKTTYDVYLNDRAYWRNVPAAVWNYKLGGYQVLKEVALLPRTRHPRPPPNPRRNPPLHHHRPPHRGHPFADT